MRDSIVQQYPNAFLELETVTCHVDPKLDWPICVYDFLCEGVAKILPHLDDRRILQVCDRKSTALIKINHLQCAVGLKVLVYAEAEAVNLLLLNVFERLVVARGGDD